MGRIVNICISTLRELFAFRKFIRLSLEERERSAAPERFVNCLIDLGPTFVKLGQILSTRPDFIPKEYIERLKALQDAVPPFSYVEVRAVINQQLGAYPEELFSAFDPNPIASASLSQVHFASLKEGAKVAVKVQRPGIADLIAGDMRLLQTLANLAERVLPRFTRNLNLHTALREFKAYTERELNFKLEGQTLERFSQNFSEWDDIVFPKVFWHLTNEKVLTMERVSGLKLDEVPEKVSAEVRKKLNNRLVEMEMKMFVSDAFFHADLHPGNIFFQEDGSIAVIDVGMFGELTSEQRDRFLLYWLAVSDQDNARAFTHFTKMAIETPQSDKEGLRRVFYDILDQFHVTSIGERSWTKTFLEIITSASKYGYQVPGELLLEAKALTTAESLAFVLVPDSIFAETSRPIILRELADRAKSQSIRKRFERTFPEWLIMGEIPEPSILPSTADGEGNDIWKEVAKAWAGEIDEHPHEAKEIRHGEYEVVINDAIDRVFNYTTRFADYELWHPTYTKSSKVIHVAGEYMFLAPGATGSVFRLDEIADGYQLQSNGVVTEFERNKHFKWRAPASLNPLVHIGTCFTFEDLGENGTRVHEYFYYLDNDLFELFKNRPWLASVHALSNHIREELNGLKDLIESGTCDPKDFTYLWEGISRPTRVAPNYLRRKNKK